MRLAIALLPLLGLVNGGCDRQSPPAEQANAARSDEVPASGPAAAPAPVRSVDRTHKGEAAPDASFLDPSGRSTSLAAFRGKPVLLNLWATWCAPCIKEMPTLDALAERRSGTLHVLTVSQDLEGSAKVAPFFAKAGYRHLQAWLDPDVKLTTHYGVNLPTTILYGADGKEIWRVSGEMDWAGSIAAKLIDEAG